MDTSMPENNQPSAKPPNQNNDLWGHTKLGLLILSIYILTILGYASCHNRNTPGSGVEIKNPPISGIKTNENNDRRNVKDDTGTPAESSKMHEHYVPPEGSVTITPIDPAKSLDEVVKIHYKELGFTFEPGLEFSGNLWYSAGIDAKLFYAYRFGAGLGLVGGTNINTIISPSAFVSYRLDQIGLNNTEAAITYVPLGKIPFGIGMRINL